MGLSEEDRKSLVNYRLEKAKETFAEIPILIENKLWRNRKIDKRKLNILCHNCPRRQSNLCVSLCLLHATL